MKRILTMALACATIIGSSFTSARADDIVRTRIVPVNNAPLQITNCKSPFWNEQFVTIANRTNHSLTSVDVQFRWYDTDGSQIGQEVKGVNVSPILTPGDSNTYEFFGGTDLSEPTQAIGFVTCRIQHATFTSRRSWQYGTAWHEKLRRIESEPAVDGDDDNSPMANDQPSEKPARSSKPSSHASHLQFTVSNAWNDNLNGALLIHTALVIQGGKHGVTVSPQDFALTMALANGGTKRYQGMTAPAPTYEKFNALTNTSTTAYEVDPKDDLGAIGSVTVPAGGSASVIVTFVIPDIVADPKANRNVSYV